MELLNAGEVSVPGAAPPGSAALARTAAKGRGATVYISGIMPFTTPLLYDRDGLSCALVPVALAAQAFGEANPDIFHAAFYLRAHYHAESLDRASGTGEPYQETLLRDAILREHLGLCLRPLEPGADLATVVTPHLDRGCPVLVPIDKGHLLTCASGYHGRSGRHLLLVKGFQPGPLDVFVVHDSEHVDPVANARLLSPDMEWPGDLLAEPSVALRTLPAPPGIAVKQLVGELYVEGYYPCVVVQAAHDRLLGGHENLVGDDDTAPLVLRRQSAARWPDAGRALEGLCAAASGLLGDLDAVVDRKLSFVWTSADARRNLTYVNSQRVFVAAVASLAQRVGIRPDLVHVLRRTGAAAAAGWNREVLLAAVMRGRNIGRTAPAENRAALVRVERAFLEAARCLY
jgi:hypothetical protein